jgi:hypothetical protein
MRQIVFEEGLVQGLLTPGLTASLTQSSLCGAYRVGQFLAFEIFWRDIKIRHPQICNPNYNLDY